MLLNHFALNMELLEKAFVKLGMIEIIEVNKHIIEYIVMLLLYQSEK